MRFTALLYVIFSVLTTPHAYAVDVPEGMPLASIDLRTDAGVAAVNGRWRYSDVNLVKVDHRAPDAQGQPTGAAVSTWTIDPQAGVNGFDDSSWPTLEPATLNQRRGNGRLSFNWYRIAITIPLVDQTPGDPTRP